MHLEFLVEEQSAEAALRVLVPKIVSADTTFDIHAFNGKTALLRKLPNRLRGYRSFLPDDGVLSCSLMPTARIAARCNTEVRRTRWWTCHTSSPISPSPSPSLSRSAIASSRVS